MRDTGGVKGGLALRPASKHGEVEIETRGAAPVRAVRLAEALFADARDTYPRRHIRHFCEAETATSTPHWVLQHLDTAEPAGGIGDEQSIAVADETPN
jgi:hypothetical protein